MVQKNRAADIAYVNPPHKEKTIVHKPQSMYMSLTTTGKEARIHVMLRTNICTSNDI